MLQQEATIEKEVKKIVVVGKCKKPVRTGSRVATVVQS